MLSLLGYAGAMDDASALRRFDPATLTFVVLLHALALFGLMRAFAADRPDTAADRPPTLTVVTPAAEPKPLPEPSPPARADSGAQGAPGRTATPHAIEAPRVALPLQPPDPLPTAASTGDAVRSGAADAGEGAGAGGSGLGTGSGLDGTGRGGWVEPTKPIKIAGDINSSADYATPRGGRHIRKGSFVIIWVDVGVDGRARNCRIATPSPDPEADRTTCRLAEERFRFEPARNSSGDPVPSSYGWRQRWF